MWSVWWCLVLVLSAAPAYAQERPEIVHPLPGEAYVLRLGEQLEREEDRLNPEVGPTPALWIRTESEFHCIMPLAIHLEVEGTQVLLSIHGIAPFGICRQMVRPASATEFLRLSAGEYQLRITADGRTDEYTLTISEHRVAVAPPAGSFTRFESTRLQRAPRYSAAFYCVIPRDSNRLGLPICQQFQQILRDSLQAQEICFDAQEGEIALVRSKVLRLEDIRFYQFRQAEDFRRAYDLLQAYRREVLAPHAEQVSLSLINWRGAEISSYLCRPEQEWCQPGRSYPPQ